MEKKKIFYDDKIEIVTPFLEVNHSMELDELKLDGEKFKSRLIMGTALFPNVDILNKSLKSSGTEIITLAIRRLNLTNNDSFLAQIEKKYKFLPNTAGCFTKKEAILTAELARETLETHWIKLELISDKEMLLPDPIELFDACKDLIKKNLRFLHIVLTTQYYAKD